MSRIVLSSPAKLNLFLKVQNKRPDGYHNIVTVFERIDLADEISFRAISANEIRIVCDHADVPLGSHNSMYKAADLIRKDTGISKGVEINIKKRIPVAAGLAGGSSNAATALFGLNHVWKLNFSRSRLLSYAQKIGSDVPFFVHNTSWALGFERGNHITKLNIRKKLWHILVVPRIKMYSGKVYNGLKLKAISSDLTSEKPSSKRFKRVFLTRKGGCTNLLTKINDDANILIHNLKEGNVLEAGRLMANDLEPEIIRLSPSLKKLKESLKSFDTKGVMISGSGSSVFGLTESRMAAERIKSVLSKRFSQVFVVRTL